LRFSHRRSDWAATSTFLRAPPFGELSMPPPMRTSILTDFFPIRAARLRSPPAALHDGLVVFLFISEGVLAARLGFFGSRSQNGPLSLLAVVNRIGPLRAPVYTPPPPGLFPKHTRSIPSLPDSPFVSPGRALEKPSFKKIPSSHFRASLVPATILVSQASSTHRLSFIKRPAFVLRGDSSHSFRDKRQNSLTLFVVGWTLLNFFPLV